MTATGKETAVVPMLAGPMYTAGDASTIPDGYTRGFRNHVIRPNRFDGRAPFVYDSLMSVVSFLRWEDLASQITKGLAIDASQNLRTKNANGTGYTATVVTGTPAGRLTDYANFLGKLYQVFDDGAGVPAAASVYDGTQVSTSPFNTPIFARTITPFIERLFLAFPRVTVKAWMQGPFHVEQFYDFGVTSSTYWQLTNCTAQNVVNGSTTICRLFQTTTAGASVAGNRQFLAGGPRGFVGTAGGQYLWRQDMRCLAPDYEMPITMEAFLSAPWIAGATIGGGYIVVDSNNNIQRASVAGTAGAGAPVWATALGAATVDNTATWINEGPNIVASLEDFIPTATDAPDFTPFWLPITVPPNSGSPTGCAVNVRLKFGNSVEPTLLHTAPVDVALRDGLTDGDPRKANRGMQLTIGDFYFPFFNCESTNVATVNLDSIVWSEIDQPARILSKNNYTLPEVAGLPTAATVVGGRYLVFKRRGLWIFRRTSDKNIPILPERPANVEVGCIGPRALDVYGDTVYFIGENGVYRMTADGDPEEICGIGMREEIMSHGSGWVESQSTYNMPFLVVEHGNREVWVYTQKSKIYIYHIPTGGWTYIDLLGAPEVRSIFYDYAGQKMLVSFGGFGATRFDDAAGTNDTIDNTATPLAVGNEVLFKPLELFAPRYEAALEEVGVFHNATAVSGTIRIAYSYDRGLTWTTPPGYPVTISLTSPRIPMPVGALGPSVMIRVSRVGPGGSANWSLSKADAKLKVLRGELPYANATT